MITVKCTFDDESFYNQLVDLSEKYKFNVEGYDCRYSDTKKKGYLKCKSAFAAKKDPFVGVWINNMPRKGFYSETEECTIDNIVTFFK